MTENVVIKRPTKFIVGLLALPLLLKVVAYRWKIYTIISHSSKMKKFTETQFSKLFHKLLF
jgi:hypothetical protein